MPDQLEIPSFADPLPEEEVLGAVEQTPEPTPAAAATATPAPAAAVPSQPDPAMERYMAMQNAQQQAAFAQQYQQQEESYRQQWDKILTPPPLPTTREAREALTNDPDALAGELEKIRNYAANAVRSVHGALIQTRAEHSVALQQVQANAAGAAARAINVSNRVGETLRNEGYTDWESALLEADAALSQNPSQYLAHRTDEKSFEAAAMYVLRQRGARPTGRPVAAPAGLGYTPSQPTSSASGDPMARYDATARSKAGQAFGTVLTADDFKKYGGVLSRRAS